MLPETFRGSDLPRALDAVRTALGDDAVVLTTRRYRDTRAYEVVAIARGELDRFQSGLERSVTRAAAARARRFRVIALVGPSGAGKTTTIAKLAISSRGFGGSRVGIISLDTYRIGAAEQIQTYADIASLPLETVQERDDVDQAVRRLAHCDVLLVDTPGRGARALAGDNAWLESLHRLQPDEVHLVLEAGIRSDVAHAALAAYDRAIGISHVLLTKIDDVPGEGGVAELAAGLDRPARWACDNRVVPDGLHPASRRLMSALCGTRTESIA